MVCEEAECQTSRGVVLGVCRGGGEGGLSPSVSRVLSKHSFMALIPRADSGVIVFKRRCQHADNVHAAIVHADNVHAAIVHVHVHVHGVGRGGWGTEIAGLSKREAMRRYDLS
jgi:hypothetical protein